MEISLKSYIIIDPLEIFYWKFIENSIFYRVCTFCNHLYSFELNGISDKQIDAEKSYKNYDKTLSSIMNIDKH